MAEMHLVTGGCRSGKSAYAQQAAESRPAPRLYVATCPVMDDPEMQARVAAHRTAREGRGWETVEEPLDLAHTLSGSPAGRPPHEVVLIDCVTLWINNLMYRAEQSGGELTEDDVVARCDTALDAAAATPGVVYWVTNEVGLGIVPENPQARRFRDLVGRANQRIAARADGVTLLVCGVPVRVKG